MVEETARNVRIVTSAPGRHVVVAGGDLVALRTARAPDGAVWVCFRGRTRRVQPAPDEAASVLGAPEGTVGDGAVTPPTPAVVVRVLVAVGDRVAQGQAVVVVSAMKMETTLTAPRDGVVSEVRAVPGARVRPGEVLVVVSAGMGGGDGNG